MANNLIENPTVKEYVSKYNLEQFLNKMVNNILINLPDDPFSEMCTLINDVKIFLFKYYLQNAKQIYKINSIKLVKKLTSEFEYHFCLEITLSFKGNTQKVLKYFLPFQKNVFEIINQNPEKIEEIFDKFDCINDYNIENFSSFNQSLEGLVQNLEDENDKLIAYNLSNSISLSSFVSMSIMNNLSLIDFIYEKYEDFILNEENIPDLGFILFKTGKEMNSKTKFENWILFVDNSSKLSSSELKEILSKIYEAIRKFLTAGKAGEGGMKLNEENSYYPPTDTMNDIIKLLENIINETGANDKLYFGIDCNANNFYNESNNTYEMDGFKKPPEIDELINFYIKLCDEHPLLKYLEDPLINNDSEGWKKLIEKFSEEKPDVKIVNKRIYNDDFQKLNNILETEEQEEEEKKETENNNVTTNNKKEEKKEEKEEEKKEEKKEDKKEEKKEEEKKEENIETETKSKITLEIQNIAINFGNLKTLNDYFELINISKDNELGVSVYDNIIESEQSCLIDLLLATRINKIILHGYTNKQDKLLKIIEYLNHIEDLYE